jgi:hypothetical protein
MYISVGRKIEYAQFLFVYFVQVLRSKILINLRIKKCTIPVSHSSRAWAIQLN